MSPAGQIITRNRSVYFELRNFPLIRDKGSAYWRTEESSGKRGRSFQSENERTDMEATYDIHREVCPAGRSGTRYIFGKAQGAGYRGIILSHGPPCPHIKLLCGRELGLRNKLQRALDKSRYVRLTGGVSLDPGLPEGAGSGRARLLE